MPATQTASHLDGSHPADGNPPSFESVWASFQEFREGMQEFRESQKEWQKEHAQDMRDIRESQKEAARLIEKNARQMEEYNKRFGEFHNRFGEIVEYMVAPNLLDKFRDLGLIFQEAISRKVVKDYDNNILFEIDVMLENGDNAMLVEVKATFTTEDVKDHIERLGKMRKYADLHGDKRVFLGAVAGVVMTSNVKKYALKQGFYVIEPSGETFNITPPDGKPKEW
jgi:hypothetical protein